MAKSKRDDDFIIEDERVQPQDDAARLQELRLKRDRGELADDEKGELAKLSLAESEAAGHVAPKPAS